MEQGGFTGVPKFENTEQELAFLREQVAKKERELESAGGSPEREKIIAENIGAYKAVAPEAVLHEKHQMKKEEVEEIVLNLTPEEHDSKMAEILSILKEKGVRNAISVVDAMNNPHIEDDFHRFLLEYIKEGFPAVGVKERSPLWRSLNMTLFEITLPEDSSDEKKTLKEIVSSMEQFFAGMTSVSDKKTMGRNYFTIELSVSNNSKEFVFYSAVPDEKKELFKKHILSIFPQVKIIEKKDDYNIFNEKGVSVGSFAGLANYPILPIKTYEEYDHDPLNVILNSFSKIDEMGEGASIQLVFNPAGDAYLKNFKSVLAELEKGKTLKKAVGSDSVLGFMAYAYEELFENKHSKDKEGKTEEKKIDGTAIDNVKKKIVSPIVNCNLRVIASSRTKEEAEQILSEVESAFNQFENTQGNKFKFTRAKGGKLRGLLKNFSWRTYSESEKMPLNLKELTTLMHFHTKGITTSPQLKYSKSATAMASNEIPATGTLLGINRDRGSEKKIFISPEDRLRHFYTIGQTGTGKSTLLKNMIVQDILAGEGVCMIDPHGVDILDVLSAIPKERYDDVIYFDPSYTERPMALNMLEFDRKFPEQKTFVVNEMLSIFDKLFDMKVAGGPMFEQYFRNSVLLVMEDPETGNTLLDVSRVLADKTFRALKLSHCKNPIVVQYWKEIAEKAGGEASLANIVPYITSKFDVFLSNDIMRPVIAQEKSSFNFREIMDNKKILLVNLSKGRLGDLNAYLIGLILVGKILMAALSRVDSIGKEMSPFYLYIDEFQNVTTNSISTILSEARKYKLSLNIAHQFIAQLDEKIRDSVFGNVGSIGAFRVGADDAEYLEKQFAPEFSAKDLMNVENRNAYVKLLVNGKPVKPFNIETLPPPFGDRANVEILKKLSYERYGGDRAMIEAEIMKKYEKKSVPTMPITPSAPPISNSIPNQNPNPNNKV